MRIGCAAVVLLCAAACSAGGSSARRQVASPPTTPYVAQVDPATFTTDVTNRYFPLVPGLTYVYEGTTDNQPERNDVAITSDTKRVAMGVTCVVVHDVEYVDGLKATDSLDYYAQDAAGAVWFFGEDTKAFNDDGSVKSTAGSWQAGVNGAQPGIVMPANPTVGASYRVEFRAGVAEDQAKVLETGAVVSVPLSTYRDAIVTKDYSPLQPDRVEHKTYAPGVGFVQGDVVQGRHEHVALVRVVTS